MECHSGENGNGKKENGDSDPFAFVKIGTEKNKQTETGAGGKSGYGGTEAESIFRKELGNDHRGGAVRDQPHKTG